MNPLLNSAKKLYSKVFPQQTTLEQMKEVIDSAEEFDRLQSLGAWEKVLRYLGAEVNGELIDATKHKYDPVKQSVHVQRWDAKREMLDKLQGWIESTQNERDRIVEEYKERADGGNDAGN